LLEEGYTTKEVDRGAGLLKIGVKNAERKPPGKVLKEKKTRVESSYRIISPMRCSIIDGNNVAPSSF